MALQDALHDRKTQTGAFKFAFSVQSLKIREQVLSMGHVKTRAVVPDAVNGLASVCSSSDFDHRLRYASCEFECVGKKIHQHLPEERRICQRLGERAHPQLDGAFGRRILQFMENLVD